MNQDKYLATWVSHSSIADFLKCPRAYFLRNVYRDPVSGKRISLINPNLALGQAVHETLESLSILPVEKRFDFPLLERLNSVWQKVSGEKGGFTSKSQEESFKKKGESMIRRVIKNPGPIEKLAVKIKTGLPNYWLSAESEIILCGKIDWLEYLPETDSVHIVDFKTGRRAEKEDSLQLPIYHLLVHNSQQRKVTQASFWYLERNDQPTEQKLPDLEKAHERVLEIAKRIRLMRKLQKFDCPQGVGGCRYCRPLEKVLSGEAIYVAENDFGQNVYVLKESVSKEVTESELL